MHSVVLHFTTRPPSIFLYSISPFDAVHLHWLSFAGIIFLFFFFRFSGFIILAWFHQDLHPETFLFHSQPCKIILHFLYCFFVHIFSLYIFYILRSIILTLYLVRITFLIVSRLNFCFLIFFNIWNPLLVFFGKLLNFYKSFQKSNQSLNSIWKILFKCFQLLLF